MKRRMLLGCLAALVIALPTSAQWQTFGNTISGSDWLGADFGSSIPLRIQTRANQPIEWYTDAVQRMRLMPTLTGQTVNTYPDFVASVPANR
ncbi:MAG: hypothetical protein KJZ58_14035 [Flavobacteriales bacterium]|nr:hypothetical protein [Flavobacteriales bacterium]